MKRLFAVLLSATILVIAAHAQEFEIAQARRPAIQSTHTGIDRDVIRFRTTIAPPPHGFPGMGAWWKNSDIAKELNLTDAQRKQLEQAFLEHRMKLVDLNADLERQELKLEPLIDADQPDENAISTQLDQVVAARGRLEKANAMMSVAMRKVLNQVQWKKLQNMHRERMPMAPFPPHAPMRMRAPVPPAAPAPAPAPAAKEPL